MMNSGHVGSSGFVDAVLSARWWIIMRSSWTGLSRCT
jgi:hypothetical protein